MTSKVEIYIAFRKIYEVVTLPLYKPIQCELDATKKSFMG